MQFILQQQQHRVPTDCQLSITLGDLSLIVCFNSSVGQLVTVVGEGRLVPCKDWRMCMCVLELFFLGGGFKGSQRELLGAVCVCVGNAEPLAEQWLAMCSWAACLPGAQKHIQAGNEQATHTHMHTHTLPGANRQNRVEREWNSHFSLSLRHTNRLDSPLLQISKGNFSSFFTPDYKTNIIGSNSLLIVDNMLDIISHARNSKKRTPVIPHPG